MLPTDNYEFGVEPARSSIGTQDCVALDVKATASLLVGTDLRRETPRGLNLDKANDAGVFLPDTSNNLTINFYSPFVALDGTIKHVVHYDVGYRMESSHMNNQGILRPDYFLQSECDR
jgi:hypothetical protein